jgi:hypothetical protein
MVPGVGVEPTRPVKDKGLCDCVSSYPLFGSILSPRERIGSMPTLFADMVRVEESVRSVGVVGAGLAGQ